MLSLGFSESFFAPSRRFRNLGNVEQRAALLCLIAFVRARVGAQSARAPYQSPARCCKVPQTSSTDGMVTAVYQLCEVSPSYIDRLVLQKAASIHLAVNSTTVLHDSLRIIRIIANVEVVVHGMTSSRMELGDLPSKYFIRLVHSPTH